MRDNNIYLRPALYVAATVVSKPGKKNDRMFTCNAGSKSIAAEAGSPIAIVAASTGKLSFDRTENMTETFWKQTKCSEEHLTFEVVRNFIEDGGAPPPIEKGETIFMVPRPCAQLSIYMSASIYFLMMMMHEIKALFIEQK